MIPYRLTALAEADLRDIFWQGLELFGPNQTERYVSELEEHLAYLGQFPDSSRLRPELDPPVRVHPYGAHVIIYEHDDDAIVVLRIRSARENWATDPLGRNEP